MFKKILIANRGEIACRIMATARSMGIRTVAVFTEPDRSALHVESADEAVGIDDYLNAPGVVEAAVHSGAEAVHPGYGFLSENAGFAAAIEEAGLTFIGPGVEAIESMGSKMRARRIMEKAGVSVAPGYHGSRQDLATLKKEAARIGFPVMLKASAGGGGRGMRIVRSLDDMKDSVASAKREAKSAFGDAALLIEKYLETTRHVEVQVFGDRFGNFVSLAERDCSIQRRHQKVVEEAPAPGLSRELREDLAAAGVAAAAAIGYVGAGTIEFLLNEDGSFYFMEMNTRLQVEHPVTEMIFGEDLVEWQLLVAAGHELPREQEELQPSGHAVEVRLYAEDPARGFLPSGGDVKRFRLGEPEQYGGAVRIDSSVREGDEVSIHYDPMIAKIIVWGIDREAALNRMSGVLEDVEIAGMPTNLDLLRRAVAHPEYMQGPVDTGFIERHTDDLIEIPAVPPSDALSLATLAVMLERTETADSMALQSHDPFSPWHSTDGWRMNGDNHHVLRFRFNEEEYPVTVHYRTEGYLLELRDSSVSVGGYFDDNGALVAHFSRDGVERRIKGMVINLDSVLTVDVGGRQISLELYDPVKEASDHEQSGGSLNAPMPGKVIAVNVKSGDTVKSGDPLLVLEAMKMEHAVTAPLDGVVSAVHFVAGDQVEEGSELLSIDAD